MGLNSVLGSNPVMGSNLMGSNSVMISNFMMGLNPVMGSNLVVGSNLVMGLNPVMGSIPVMGSNVSLSQALQQHSSLICRFKQSLQLWFAFYSYHVLCRAAAAFEGSFVKNLSTQIN